LTHDHEGKPHDGRGLREKMLGERPDPMIPTEAQKAAQAKRCSCGGSDDYCPCQNVIQRTDYGKPGDPSGCYFPAEWRSPGAKIGHENREAVRQFFALHIGCTNVECGKAVATLRKEWTA
jgi:hypothetical protein